MLVETDTTRILVDAGFSGSEIERRLTSLDRTPDEIDAVVVTHEHRDHTAGIGIGARRWGISSREPERPPWPPRAGPVFSG